MPTAKDSWAWTWEVEFVGGPEHGVHRRVMSGLPLMVAALYEGRIRQGVYKDVGPDDPTEPNHRIYEWAGWSDGEPPSYPCFNCGQETKFMGPGHQRLCGFCADDDATCIPCGSCDPSRQTRADEWHASYTSDVYVHRPCGYTVTGFAFEEWQRHNARS